MSPGVSAGHHHRHHQSFFKFSTLFSFSQIIDPNHGWRWGSSAIHYPYLQVKQPGDGLQQSKLISTGSNRIGRNEIGCGFLRQPQSVCPNPDCTMMEQLHLVQLEQLPMRCTTDAAVYHPQTPGAELIFPWIQSQNPEVNHTVPVIQPPTYAPPPLQQPAPPADQAEQIDEEDIPLPSMAVQNGIRPKTSVQTDSASSSCAAADDDGDEEPPKMTLMIWNCRGSEQDDFRTSYRSMLDYHRPALVLLLETHMTNHQYLADDFEFTDIANVPATGGNSGGMALVWKNDLVTVDGVMINNEKVHCTIKCRTSISSWGPLIMFV
ncbi:hypothetical protein HAX54_036315 [Datura stramonium]|uniref:Endonuclease/exonuclease/phosphatase domain-containing protein n=1 Tax=Datura stramonium TaxID=4076 RepID=A0ABS8RMC6_DATST|nr:hypothetical protein [Datura stramonium]